MSWSGAQQTDSTDSVSTTDSLCEHMPYHMPRPSLIDGGLSVSEFLCGNFDGDLGSRFVATDLARMDASLDELLLDLDFAELGDTMDSEMGFATVANSLLFHEPQDNLQGTLRPGDQFLMASISPLEFRMRFKCKDEPMAAQ